MRKFYHSEETTVSPLDDRQGALRCLPTAYVIAMELVHASLLQHIARGFEEREAYAEVIPEVADTKAASGNVRLQPIPPLCGFFVSSSIRDSPVNNGEEEVKSEMSDASSFDDDGLKRPNDLYERYLFRIRTQRDGESHRKFLQALKDQADNCDFGESSDVMVRDQVIFGTNNAELRELMLGQRNLTMAKVEELCRAADDGMLGNHVLGNSNNNDPNFRKRRIRKRSCPTQERMCYLCRRRGHFGPECTAGPVVIEDALENSGEFEDCELFGWFHPDFFKGFGVF
ncbi:uncharacterized protein [Dermacentor albipictus]|uniref:uncharacterized protein n=1 Tax=Dermacentor albipictus TaxID=60249 RepID=UPI0038FCA25F